MAEKCFAPQAGNTVISYNSQLAALFRLTSAEADLQMCVEICLNLSRYAGVILLIGSVVQPASD